MRGDWLAALAIAILPVVVSPGPTLADEVGTADIDLSGMSPETATAAKRFHVFCGEWAEKLRARERHNRTKIDWRPGGQGVVGEYVGYETETYEVKPSRDVKAIPIGKMVYLELRLRVTGGSESEALARKPEIIERTEVTELFRYDRGSWVY